MANYTKCDQLRAEMLKPYLPAPARGAAHPPRKAPARAPAGPVPTLAQLRACCPWLWVHCPKCIRFVAIALAPWIIRWGGSASSDMLRESFTCARCGHKGALLQHPSMHSCDDGFPMFPVERMH